MSWAIGYDERWGRDIGYGVPALCEHPGCEKEIHRGLSYVCGGEPYGGGCCGLYFCEDHLDWGENDDGETVQMCDQCINEKPPFKPKPNIAEWINWKLTDESWAQWREENPELVSILMSEK